MDVGTIIGGIGELWIEEAYSVGQQEHLRE